MLFLPVCEFVIRCISREMPLDEVIDVVYEFHTIDIF